MIEKLFEMIINGIVGNFSYEKLKNTFGKSDSKGSKKPPNKPYASSAIKKPGAYKVPSNINFDTTLLLTPSLEDMGIPAPLAYLPYIKCHVKDGEWVERGSPLVTYKLVFYKDPEPSHFFFRLFFGDETYTHTFDLNSPMSGFVTDTRSVTCRKSESARSCFLGMFDKENVLPTLLVPQDEPAWSNTSLDSIRAQICTSITKNWKLNQHNLGGGSNDHRYKNVRLYSAIDKGLLWSYHEEEKDQLSKALYWLENSQYNLDTTEITWPMVDYTEYRTTWNTSLDGYIEFYRAKDHSLRDKLVHLIHA